MHKLDCFDCLVRDGNRGAKGVADTYGLVVSGFHNMVESGFQNMVESGFQNMVESGFHN